MIKVFKSLNGSVKEVDTAKIDLKKAMNKRLGTRQQEVIFVNCYKPNEAALKELSRLVGFEVQDLKELLTEEVRPRIEEDDDNNLFLIVFRAPFYEDVDEIITAPIAFFIKGNVIFSLCNYKIKSMGGVLKALQAGKMSFLFKKQVGYFLFYLLDKINDEYLNIMNKIGDTSEIIKDKGDSFSKVMIEKIDSLNTTLIYFNRALLGNAEVITILKKGRFTPFKKFNNEYFDDLYFDALQLLDLEKIQRDVITSIFNFQSALSSFELNKFMKRLTMLALIIAIPTLLTSAYGMNFKVIPLQNHPYGFYITTFVIMLLTIPAIYMFKKLDKL